MLKEMTEAERKLLTKLCDDYGENLQTLRRLDPARKIVEGVWAKLDTDRGTFAEEPKLARKHALASFMDEQRKREV